MAEPPSSTRLPEIGETIAGKYQIVRAIGQGGMGVVFEALQLKIGRRVALKVLQPSVVQSAEVVSRFEREARAAGKLGGIHAARVLDVDTTPARLPYMVMEYLDGHDLQTELEQRVRFPLEEALDYVLQACAGIAEAHDIGIIHRDLKPSNLFLCDEGDRRIVKILDFGISKMLGEASKLTSTELTIGTPLYMSPEQVRSAKNVDARTDVWALGIILYELLTGRPPWNGSGPSVAAAIVTDPPPPLAELGADVPAEIEQILQKALAKKQDDRFPDVRAFATALAAHVDAPRSLGRASLDSALRAARAAVVGARPPGERASGEMAHAPTLLSDELLAAPPSSAPAVSEPGSTEPRPSSTTRNSWSTGGLRHAPGARRLAFFTALFAAVAGLSLLGLAAFRSVGPAAVASAKEPSQRAREKLSPLDTPPPPTSLVKPDVMPDDKPGVMPDVARPLASAEPSTKPTAVTISPARPAPGKRPRPDLGGSLGGQAGRTSTAPAAVPPAPSSKIPLHM